MTRTSGTGPNLTYPDPGATSPESARWVAPSGDAYRAFERTVPLGSGAAVWESASAALLMWGVKTGSGFRVEPAGEGNIPAGRVRAGADYRLIALLGPFRVPEPVRVVAVVDTPDRRGFAYGTLDGHPVSGEEAFILSRGPGGEVRLTLRSLTRPGRGVWRIAFPLALIAQRRYRARYVRALRP
ncbi:DUF1990 family protein [Lysobacter korlensis]|uniref:DUF1990 family protein n=1 Tax=Lysobacter korlensis TaxID=553636 RepID=A0ABV6S169_9GAMM